MSMYRIRKNIRNKDCLRRQACEGREESWGLSTGNEQERNDNLPVSDSQMRKLRPELRFH